MALIILVRAGIYLRETSGNVERHLFGWNMIYIEKMSS